MGSLFPPTLPISRPRLGRTRTQFLAILQTLPRRSKTRRAQIPHHQRSKGRGKHLLLGRHRDDVEPTLTGFFFLSDNQMHPHSRALLHALRNRGYMIHHHPYNAMFQSEGLPEARLPDHITHSVGGCWLAYKKHNFLDTTNVSPHPSSELPQCNDMRGRTHAS